MDFSKLYAKIFIFSISFTLTQSIFAENKFNLVTENYPPFNMEESGKVIGMSADVMRELMKREEIEYSMVLYPWSRALKMGLEEKDTAVFSTARTPERDPLFKWVGPLVANDWVFFGKEGTKIKLKSLDDAKKYKVGCYHDDAACEYLLKEGFKKGKNLIVATKDNQNSLKLEAGRIDLWATGAKEGIWVANQQHSKAIVPLYTYKRVDLYAAFNKATDDILIKKLNETLDKMKKDGTVTKIFDKYK